MLSLAAIALAVGSVAAAPQSQQPRGGSLQNSLPNVADPVSGSSAADATAASSATAMFDTLTDDAPADNSGTAQSPAAAPASPVHTPGTPVGDYVEARSCSVFAGACHYNGELVTTGREAVMAWSIASGKWKGVDLAGVKVAAAVASEDNLGNARAERKSELAIDSSATDAQAAAIADAIKSHYAASLGDVVSVRRTTIEFRHEGRQYSVIAAGFVKLAVQGMPNDECCKQPNLVWYNPLAPLTLRKVGYTSDAAYTAGDITDAWQRSGENSAFYGPFAF
jgi:hypothetical protein